MYEDGYNICRTKFYRYSIKKDEWLGNGIYFFEEERHAVDWCINFKCSADNNHYMVTINEIESDTDNIIDLVDPEQRKMLFVIMDRLESTIRKYCRDNNCRADGFVLNHIYDKVHKYDLVRHCFFKEDTYVKKYKGLTRINDIQYQICVRNRDCIKSIKPYIEGRVGNGYEYIKEVL